MAHEVKDGTPSWNKKRTSSRILAPLLTGIGLVAASVAFVTIKDNEVKRELYTSSSSASVSTLNKNILRETSDITDVSPHIVLFLVDDMGYNDIG